MQLPYVFAPLLPTGGRGWGMGALWRGKGSGLFRGLKGGDLLGHETIEIHPILRYLHSGVILLFEV